MLFRSGKAYTYAIKYALLKLFRLRYGDDADFEASKPLHIEKPKEEKPVVKVQPVKAKPATAPTAATTTTPSTAVNGHAIKTPLPGVIIDVKVNVGDEVKKGTTVVVLEAMKMENNINTDRDGKVVAVQVAKGDTVADGAVLVVIE